MKTRETIEHIVRWLVSYLEESGLEGFAVGVSGGIDSAVTSTLCALTKKKVIALDMPIFQATDQVSRARAHISWLEKKFANVKGVHQDLTDLFTQVQKTFPVQIQDELTMANTRSRLRMVTLYAFASAHRLLVAGTGNKVEDFGVGFFTKYGDGGVDISPIADLLKTQVYELGKELGIIEDIMKAPPTDGLWEDNRTDENQIGASYAELEWAMNHIDAQDKSGMTERQKQVLDIFRKFHSANLHKMKPIPVCMIPDDLKN